MATQERTKATADTHQVLPARGSNRINVGQGERIASTLSGGLLALWGLRRFSVGGFIAAAAGSMLLYRGATGHGPIYERLGYTTAEEHGEAAPVEIDETVTVQKPRGQVYAFWRDIENLPRFMRHLETVEDLGEGRSRWTARAPKDLSAITWTATTIEDEEGTKVAWRSEPDADVQNAGTVTFREAPQGGTEVRVQISYRPPAGLIGTQIAQWLNPAAGQLIKEDVRRFKHILEAGEVPTIEGQPSGQH